MPRRPTATIATAVLAVGALAGGLLVAALAIERQRRADHPPISVELAAAELAPANRILPAATTCPTGRLDAGSSTALGDVAYRDPGDSTVRNLVAPGQLVVFELAVRAGPTSRPTGVAAHLAWERGAANGAGYDGRAVVCAFVDATDPATSDSATPASLEWSERPADGAEVELDLVLEGIDPGDTAVVEVWLVTRPAVVSADSRLLARVVDARASSGQAVAVRRPALPYRMASFDRVEPAALLLSGSDDDTTGRAHVDRVAYRWRIENPAQVAIVPAARFDAHLDPAVTLASDVVVDDRQGAPSTCAPTGDGFGCELGFLNPGEVITLRTTAAVGDRAGRRARVAHPDRGCAEPTDLCSTAELRWTSAVDTQDHAAVGVASDLAPRTGLLVGRSLAGGGYVGGGAVFAYTVEAIDRPYRDVSVTDSACVTVARGPATAIDRPTTPGADRDAGTQTGANANANSDIGAGTGTGTGTGTDTDQDTDTDDRLDPGEMWTFHCSTPAGLPRAGAHPERAEVEARGRSDDGRTVRATARPAFSPIDPRLELQIALLPGEPTGRQLQVINDGDADLSDITISAATCRPLGRPIGDTRLDHTLEPGEVWRYTCLTDDPAGPQLVEVRATDPLGGDVVVRGGSGTSTARRR